MKKNLYFQLILLIHFSAPLFGQEYQTDFFPTTELSRILIEQPLKGSPVSFTIRTQELLKDSASLYLSPIVERYTVEEDRIKEISFEFNGRVIKQFKFDSTSRILSFFDFQEDAGTPWIFYEYNNQNHSKTETRFRKDSTVYSKTVLNFNSNGKLISRNEFWGENKVKSIRQIDYNELDEIVRDSYFENQNQNINEHSYSYDSIGRKEKSEVYNNERLQSRTMYEYRQDSIISQKMEFGFNKRAKSQFLVIEKDSMRVEVTGYFSGGDTTSYRSSFKQIFVEEDLVEYESRTIKGTFVDRYKTFYEYDNRGNWIKKTTYLNNKLIKVQNRLFRY